jgi:hypothetical protein
MSAAYTFYVRLKGKRPKTYRLLQIDGLNTLADLCDLILESFDFDDEHLYCFEIDNGMFIENYYHPAFAKEAGELSADETIESLIDEDSAILLHYDFGDDWYFEIAPIGIEETGQEVQPKILESHGSLKQYR